MMKLLDRLERKIGKIAIPNLMLLMVAGMATVFIFNFLTPQLGIYNYLSLSWPLVMQGEIWRVISFLFMPISSSALFIIFVLYFYYMIGSSLESYWGTFRFNAYYFIGVIGTIISAVITGYADNTFLNLSLFFAFAVLNPNFQIRLFFFIPLKIKYLAFFNAAIFAVSFLFGSWSTRIEILFSLANFLLFFGGDFINKMKHRWKFRQNRREFKQYWN